MQPDATLTHPGSLPYRPLRAVALALLAAATCLLVAATSLGHFVLYGLVGVMFVLCFGPAASAVGAGRMDWFEVVHLRGLVHFLQFGVGGIAVFHDPFIAFHVSTVAFLPETVFYATIGYGTFLIGYFLVVPRQAEEATVRRREEPRGVLALVLPGAIGFAGYYAWAKSIHADTLGERTVSGVFSLLGQMSPLFLFAWALGWIQFMSGRRDRPQTWALFGFLGPCVLAIIWLYFSDKSVAFTLMLVPLMAYWYSRRKMPWVRLVALALILIFVLFPVFNTYRVFDPLASREERVSMTLDTLSRWDRGMYLDRSALKFVERMALIPSFLVIVREVGRWEPYLGLERVMMAPLILTIPRFIWPDKPKLQIGREFAEKFRLVHFADDHTSLAPSLPGEFYWYAGVPGMLIGMALFGAGFGWFYRRFGLQGSASPVDLAIYIMFLPRLLTIDGGLMASVLGTIKLLLVVAALRMLLRRAGAIGPVERPSVT